MHKSSMKQSKIVDTFDTYQVLPRTSGRRTEKSLGPLSFIFWMDVCLPSCLYMRLLLIFLTYTRTHASVTRFQSFGSPIRSSHPPCDVCRMILYGIRAIRIFGSANARLLASSPTRHQRLLPNDDYFPDIHNHFGDMATEVANGISSNTM